MHIQDFLQQLHLPVPQSHKGENGKALIIGGSDLFHAASQWSFLAASRLVDMTFYSSIAENNQLLYDAKFYGHDGVIVPRKDILSYIEEANSILIGPGMRRDVQSRFSAEELAKISTDDLTESDWENDTQAVTQTLTQLGSTKKWVIDAGALQVIQPGFVPKNSVLTPHSMELLRLAEKVSLEWVDFFEKFLTKQDVLIQKLLSSQETFSYFPQVESESFFSAEEKLQLFAFSQVCNDATFLLKGPIDTIWNSTQVVFVSGGNAGMTKGGTGDVLAGSLLGFLASSDVFPSTVVASYLNKLAGHMLYEKTDVMFNSSDLVEILPVAWKSIASQE